MLEVKDITVKISGYTILRRLSLSLPKEKIMALVGRNGAGKTTTIRAIMGLVPVAEGIIRLDGQELTPLSPHHRAKLGIGYLPEDRRLIGALTVEENLLVPAQALAGGSAKEVLPEIYELLPELKDLAKRKAMQLSGGQQKLVALARSFVNGCRLLLLDEPFEGISTALSKRLAQVVHLFLQQRSGLSVLVAESDLKRATMLTQNILLIERGEVMGEDVQVPTAQGPVG